MASAFLCCAAAAAAAAGVRHRAAAAPRLLSSARAAAAAVRPSVPTPSLTCISADAAAASASVPLTTPPFPLGCHMQACLPSSSRLSGDAAVVAAQCGAAPAAASRRRAAAASRCGAAAESRCGASASAAGLASSACAAAECSEVAGACDGAWRSSNYGNALLPCGRQEYRRYFSSSSAAAAGEAVETGEKKEEGGSPTLEGRYAVALLRAAKQQNQLQTVYEEVMNLKELLQQSEDFRRFIETPALSNSQKEALLQQLGSTYKLQQVTVNLLQMLLENKRMPLLGRVADAFEILYRKEKGEVRCLVSSAHPLSSQQQKEVVAALQKRAGPRAKLILDYVVNPQLMGGLIVRLGDQVLDFSVATRIDRLQAQLMAPL